MATKLNLGISDDLLHRVTKSLGPSIYDLDTEVIACGQKDELEALKKNFIKKQLEVTADDEAIDKAIDEVCEEMGRSNSVKFRALFYILLTRKFNKESFYDA
jgi:TusA-related sulfurtransferase